MGVVSSLPANADGHFSLGVSSMVCMDSQYERVIVDAVRSEGKKQTQTANTEFKKL